MYNQNSDLMKQEKFTLPTMTESDFSAEELAEDADGLQMSFQRVKIPAGGTLQFEMPSNDPDNPDYEKTLVGVILHNHATCAYWPAGSEYDDDTTPLCSSVDGKVGIGTPGGACAACVMNRFGSAPDGSKGKACKNMRVLYLLRSGEYMPLQVNLPPTSIKPFKEFLNRAFMFRRRATYGSIVQTSSLPPAHRLQCSWYPFPQSTAPSDAEYPCRFLWSTPLHFSFHPEAANTA